MQDDGHLNQLNEKLLNALQQGGDVFLSSAVVEGKSYLRTCIDNFRTSAKDITDLVDIIVREGAGLTKRFNKTNRPVQHA